MSDNGENTFCYVCKSVLYFEEKMERAECIQL